MSTELATCMGCFMNASYPWPVAPSPYNTIQQTVSPASEPMTATNCCMFNYIAPPNVGMTVEELKVVESLVAAWTDFLALDAKHPDDNAEFLKAIHDAQKMIALRVARRVDPHIWFQPEE